MIEVDELVRSVRKWQGLTQRDVVGAELFYLTNTEARRNGHKPASLAWHRSVCNVIQRLVIQPPGRSIRYNISKAMHVSQGSIDMLTNEMKRQVFLKLRSQNYRASLRLEGLVQLPAGVNKPLAEATVAAPTKKHVR